MKQWKKLLPLTLIATSLMMSGCGSDDGREVCEIFMEGCEGEYPAPAPTPEPEQTQPNLMIVGCRTEPNEEWPQQAERCEVLTIQPAIEFWNKAAEQAGLFPIFKLDLETLKPDVTIVYDWAPIFVAQNEVYVPSDKNFSWEWIARALGRGIGLPNNENPFSIMDPEFEKNPKELQVTPEDLDAYLNLEL